MRISDWSSDVCSSDLVEPGDSQPGLVESPFAATAALGTSSEAKNAELLEEEELTQAPAPESDSLTKTVVVANGDTLSTVFSKVGISPSVMHTVLSSSKDAKKFSRLKIGQSLEFQMTEKG